MDENNQDFILKHFICIFFSQQHVDRGVMAWMAILKPRSSSKYFKKSCLYEVKEIVNLLDTTFYTKKNQYAL